jgi:hypothetical protein
MAKKVPHTEDNILGFSKINGVRVPFWEDNAPLDLEERLGLHKEITSITMCLGPRPTRPSPKPKRR